MGKYTCYTADFKLKVINYAEEHGNQQTAHKFCITESHMRYWQKQKNQLEGAKKSSLGFKRVKPKFPEIERELLQYI
jgi:hypothetical protein